MPINAGYEYFAAEKKYAAAKTTDEKIAALEEMIKAAPKHKSSENFVANLKQRLNKTIEKKEKSKKTGKSTKKSIRKEGFQCVLTGFTNSGKSALLSKLTNAKPLISPYAFSTYAPELGTMDFTGVKSQVIDMPAIGAEAFDIGLVNTADCVLVVITDLQELNNLNPILQKAIGKRIIVYNKIDLKSDEERRKLEATIKSKKIDAVIVSAQTGEGIEELKEKIFSKMGVMRIYMKEPGKEPSKIPLVLDIGSTIQDAAESILKGFSKRIKESKVTGPSGKFPNQKVGISHVLKDRDVIEFHTN
ncbi:MAG TPA: GTPase [Candidatus Nanoarchaeia archaeon]|nr:GTPase [Candidatus Nanoarchaeia archaeon]